MSPSVNLKCSDKAKTINVCANFNTIPTEKGATMNNLKMCSYTSLSGKTEASHEIFCFQKEIDKTIVVNFTDSLLHRLSLSVNLYTSQLYGNSFCVKDREDYIPRQHIVV